MYRGGDMADRRISVGESSEEWLILGSAMGTVEMVSREWEYRRICCVVGSSNANWGCGRWIVEVYKCFSEHVHWGLYRCSAFRLERLDNSCLGAWECVA